jgi:hypothetical protein
MNFCAKCGRERSGDARYCGGCGTEFAADTAAAITPPTDDSAGADPQPSATADWAPPADATRIERPPDVTMIDRPGGAADSARAATPASAEPDPFAAWFAPSPDAQAAPRTEPGGQRQAAEPWQSADTVYAGSGQRAPAYPPSPQPAPGYPPPRPPYGTQPPPSGGRRSSGGRKVAFILVVVLVMLAAGGGAYALVSRSSKHNTAQPPASPTAASSATPTAASSASASTSPSAGTSPSVSASVSASASTSPTSGLVSVGSGVASNATESAVETTLNLNFEGINAHNYTEYQNARTTPEQATESQSAFTSGYGSTSDSGITLTSLTSAANGGEEATVTFTSHQAAGTGVDGRSCNNWTLIYYMVPEGSSYLIGPPPSGYQPTHSDC